MHFSCLCYSLYSINTKLHKIKFKRPRRNIYREIHKKIGSLWRNKNCSGSYRIDRILDFLKIVRSKVCLRYVWQKFHVTMTLLCCKIMPNMAKSYQIVYISSFKKNSGQILYDIAISDMLFYVAKSYRVRVLKWKLLTVKEFSFRYTNPVRTRFFLSNL